MNKDDDATRKRAELDAAWNAWMYARRGLILKLFYLIWGSPRKGTQGRVGDE